MSLKTWTFDNEVAQKIVKYIHDKGLSEGERVLAERKLAVQFNVSRNSLREALKILQSLDIVEVQHGRGIFVKNPEFSSNGQMTMWLGVHSSEITELLSVREALEVKAIELIPISALGELSNKLIESIRKVECSNFDTQAFVEHDLEFHNLVRKASGNKLLLNICHDITDVVITERRVLFSDYERKIQSYEEHKAIAEAMRTKDRNKVIKALRDHITSVREIVLAAQKTNGII